MDSLPHTPRFHAGDPLSASKLNQLRDAIPMIDIFLRRRVQVPYLHPLKIYRAPKGEEPSADDWRTVCIHSGTINATTVTGTDGTLFNKKKRVGEILIPEGVEDYLIAIAATQTVTELQRWERNPANEWIYRKFPNPSDPWYYAQETAVACSDNHGEQWISAYGSSPYSPGSMIDDPDYKHDATITAARIVHGETEEDLELIGDEFSIVIGKVSADAEKKKLTIKQGARGNLSYLLGLVSGDDDELEVVDYEPIGATKQSSADNWNQGVVWNPVTKVWDSSPGSLIWFWTGDWTTWMSVGDGLYHYRTILCRKTKPLAFSAGTFGAA